MPGASANGDDNSIPKICRRCDETGIHSSAKLFKTHSSFFQKKKTRSSSIVRKWPICNKKPISHDVHICEDGSLLKSIIGMGEKEESPNDNDVVLVDFLAFFPDHTFIQKAHQVKFKVKDGLFCPALQLAVKTMKMEEKALLYVTPKHGFGEKGKYDGDLLASVPPNASFTICLTLISWEKFIPFYKEVIKEGEGDDCPEEGALV